MSGESLTIPVYESGFDPARSIEEQLLSIAARLIQAETPNEQALREIFEKEISEHEADNMRY